MFCQNEIRLAPRIESDSLTYSDKELSMAPALIKGYRGEFDPAQFKDLYQERIGKIIDAQMSRRLFETQPSRPRVSTGADDLMEQIRLSLAQIQSNKPGGKSSKKAAGKTASVAKKKAQNRRA
jgi:non-homologous end joining protein Ku